MDLLANATPHFNGESSSADYFSCKIKQSSFVWVLGSLCRLHSLPFDSSLVIQQYPHPQSVGDLLLAAEELGIDIETAVHSLPDSAMETQYRIVFKHIEQGGSESETTSATQSQRQDSTPSTVEPALVGHITQEVVTLFNAGDDGAEVISVEQYTSTYLPFYLKAIHKVDDASSEERDTEPRKFGFSWFIPELLRHRRVWRDVLLASCAIQIMSLATPLFTQVIIDKVIVHHTLNTLYVVAFALFMFMTFSALMSWIRQYLVLHTGNRVDAVLGSRVFSHLFRLPIRYFEHRATGTLVARIQGIETIREFISGAAVTLLLDLPFLLIFLAIMIYYSWQLTLIVIGIVSLISLISTGVAPVLRRRLNEQFQLGARNQALVTEYINAAETVKTLQMESRINKRYGDYLATYLLSSFNTRKLSNTYTITAQTLEQFQVLGILSMGAWLVMTTEGFTVGMLVAFQMFAQRFSQPVLRLVNLWLEFQKANIAVKRLGDIMDVPAEPYALKPSRDKQTTDRISIENLGFRYDKNRDYLYKNLNLVLDSGKLVVLLGASGSGKSTLIKLLLGFYRPTEGRILINGRDIRHLAANEIRNYFGVVPQETVLFAGTVYENLQSGNPHATFEQIIQSCRMADIHHAIEQLPEGYQTRIGEHGTGLSGGQKQRLAIARALLKRPRFILFDEATSSLDHATSLKLTTTINALKGKVTILFITHHVPDGLDTDLIVNLSDKRENND